MIKSKMKLLLVFMLSFVVTTTFAQTSNISVSLKDQPLRQLIRHIESNTNFTFMLDQTVDQSIPVTVVENNANINTIMTKALSGKSIAYELMGSQILLKNTAPRYSSQTKTIKGKVTDESGEAIIGANIALKGTTTGTSSDIDGHFTLVVPVDAIITVSYVGFIDQDIRVAGGTDFTIVMRENAEVLDEVVIIGYGTVRKSDLTGSVGSLTMDNVNKVGVTSAERALQGQIAGVQVNSRTGQPGESFMIRIRGGNSLSGKNEPLYVLDGLPIEGMSSDINPEDILSIEVLKDASSTAIYGSRGANGVVLITTKRGKAKELSVSYDGYFGVSQLRKKLDLLGKDDYIAMVNEVSQNDGNGISITPQEAALLPNIDWQDQAYQNALTHSHQLAVTGGNESTKLYASLNYLNQEGIIKGSSFNRFGLRINGDQKITEKMNLSASIAYSYGTRRDANSNADGYGAIAYTAMVMPPIQDIFDENGKYTVFKGTPWGGTNPVGMSELYNNETINSKLIANMALDYNIVDGLNLRVNAGAEINAYANDRYIPIGLSAGGAINGDAYKRKANYYSLINENILTYDKRFNRDHVLKVMGGITFQTYQYDNLTGTAKGFLRDIYETNNLGAGSDPGKPASGYSDYKMVSFLGRLNYNLKEKYLFTATARYDGSSKFSKNHKFAFFPSAALAWRMSEEGFMKEIDWLTNLKLRASIGQTGSQAIDAYTTQAQLATSTPVFQNGKDIGFHLSSMANDNLKWETTTQTDIGVDFGFFNNRLNITFDYYWKQTRDLLYKATLPPSSGYSNMLRNIGRIDNKGLEFTVTTVNMQGAVNWTTNLNITANRSKVVDLGEDIQGNKIMRMDAPISGGNWFPLFVGKAPFQLYGYEIDGIYQTDEEARNNGEATKKAGDYRYKDQDGKPGITTGDKTVLTNLQPLFTFGLTNTISWKNFEFSFLAIGSVGNDIVNEFNKSITNIGGSWNIRKDVWENRWQPGTGGKFARPSAATKDYLSFGDPSSVWVENGSYLRFKDIKFSYRLPQKWFNGTRKPDIMLYVSGQNLITITSYSHYDPEASWTSSAVNGWDRGVYPSSKSYTFGLQVKF